MEASVLTRVKVVVGVLDSISELQGRVMKTVGAEAWYDVTVKSEEMVTKTVVGSQTPGSPLRSISTARRDRWR